ncbi:hypothetical protein NQ176_g8048 [Zarea fungicola]|uniref:Uncharacterized protein n=1 Tax=Zarea fungicola TaxID=93591 RepID=A0ACC1MWU4_9HYPO|nr:hypothetical protein NQ176_g8048 [Lecanicillium fungicola]
MAATFKVLIAGGGPVGLTTALALSRANISFTLLEKYHTVVPEAGSDLVLSPVGLRALSQLGLFDALDGVSTPLLGPMQRIDHNGKDLGRMNFFDVFKEQLGQAPRVLRRYDLCKVLYDAIQKPESILCNKEVTEIQETEQGIEASCADGTTYKADMIIGADGVHSIVRRQITSINDTPLVGSVKTAYDIDDVFTAKHRCLWISFSLLPGLPIGGTFETHGPGASTQMRQ